MRIEIALAFLMCFEWATLTRAQPQAVEVYCPAIAQDDTDDRGADVPDNILPVVAIVVGSLDQDTMRLSVDRTLFGPHLTEMPLAPMKPEYLAKEGDPRVYCISTTRAVWKPVENNNGTLILTYGPEYKFTISPYYEHYRVFSLKEETSLLAMAQARQDLLVLGSALIFVGDTGTSKLPTEEDARPIASIRVGKVISGDPSYAGKTIYARAPFDPYLSPNGKFIYFVKSISQEEGKTIFGVQRRWPTSELRLVVDTLKRRAMFPVKNGRQEVLFTGTIKEAIELIASNCDAAQTLAARRLIVENTAAIPAIVGFVESHLFDQATPGNDFSFQQHQLIRVLGIIEKHRTDGELGRLINLMLDHIDAGQTYQASTTGIRAIENHNSFEQEGNRSLIWMTEQIDEPVLAIEFGERLLRLKSSAKDKGWRRIAQECDDQCHIGDQLELLTARKRMLSIAGVKWSASGKAGNQNSGHAQPIDEVVFVDGAKLKTQSEDGVVNTWDARTGAALGREIVPIKPKKLFETNNPFGEVNAPLLFDEKAKTPNDSFEQVKESGRQLDYDESELLSEDRKHWYLFRITDSGGKYGPPRKLEVEIGDVAELSTENTRKNVLKVTGGWRPIGNIALRWKQYEPWGLVPDGKSFHFCTQIFRRDNLSLVSGANVTGEIEDLQFFDGGSRYLLTTTERETHPGPFPGVYVSEPVKYRIRIHDTNSGKTEFVWELAGAPGCHTALSPDGRLLAIVDGHNKISVWPIANN
jgi:hypothetical protein